MPIKEPQEFNLIGNILIFIMTILGATASYAYRILKGEEFRWSILFLQAIVAVFAGALVMLTASYYSWAAEAAGGISGLAGWSGAEFIKTLEKRFLSRIKGERK